MASSSWLSQDVASEEPGSSSAGTGVPDEFPKVGGAPGSTGNKAPPAAEPQPPAAAPTAPAAMPLPHALPSGPVCTQAVSDWLREHNPLLAVAVPPPALVPVQLALTPTSQGMTILHLLLDDIRDKNRRYVAACRQAGHAVGYSAIGDAFPVDDILAIPGVEHLVNTPIACGANEGKTPLDFAVTSRARVCCTRPRRARWSPGC